MKHHLNCIDKRPHGYKGSCTTGETTMEERFKKSFPRFKGVGAMYPMFEDTPVWTHVLDFINNELALARADEASKKEFHSFCEKCRCFTPNKHFACIRDERDARIKQAVRESRKQTLKELILEQQANELEGKGYDFYFNVRIKLDALLAPEIISDKK